MDYEYNDRKQESVYSRRLKAGKRRTYFFDVRETKGNDFFLTITESRKRFNDDGYDRHKIFLYKEDFNKFINGLTEAVDFVKTDLMPDYDFDIFSHAGEEQESGAVIRPLTVKTQQVEPEAAAPAEQIKSVEGTEPQVAQPDASIKEEETAALSDFEAEPMRAEVRAETEAISSEDTVDKLASEEVEKW